MLSQPYAYIIFYIFIFREAFDANVSFWADQSSDSRLEKSQCCRADIQDVVTQIYQLPPALIELHEAWLLWWWNKNPAVNRPGSFLQIAARSFNKSLWRKSLNKASITPYDKALTSTLQAEGVTLNISVEGEEWCFIESKQG